MFKRIENQKVEIYNSRELENLTDKQLLIIAVTKLDNVIERVDDHESRLRLIEKLGFLLIGGIYVIDLISKFLT